MEAARKKYVHSVVTPVVVQAGTAVKTVVEAK